MSIGTTSPYRDDESSSATLVDLARMHIERSPKAGQQRVSRETVLRLLQESLTEELACVQRCKRHHYRPRYATRARCHEQDAGLYERRS